jgi:hypothetical protein
MLGNYPFSSWPSVVFGAVCFGMVFELPLVLADYVTEGLFGLSGSTLAFGVAAFVGYVVVGGAIMKTSTSPPSGV